MTHVSSQAITIRAAHGGDGAAVARLAALDSAEVPGGELLLAEVGGELQAALSLDDGAVIADPFRRTAELVRLLALRAELLARPTTGRRRRRGLASWEIFMPMGRQESPKQPGRRSNGARTALGRPG